MIKIANTNREFLHIFWTTWRNSITFSGKICFKTILKIPKIKVSPSLYKIHFPKTTRGRGEIDAPSSFRFNCHIKIAAKNKWWFYLEKVPILLNRFLTMDWRTLFLVFRNIFVLNYLALHLKSLFISRVTQVTRSEIKKDILKCSPHVISNYNIIQYTCHNFRRYMWLCMQQFLCVKRVYFW